MNSNQNNHEAFQEKQVSPADLPLEPDNKASEMEKQYPVTEIGLPTDNNPLIPLQEEKNMEVHHHGHVHESKKWKEYLFQFLMLFLAVFAGFWAEYQLEHKIEKERGKQYVYSLYEDLHGDTAALNVTIRRSQLMIQRIDSVTLLFRDQRRDTTAIRSLYNLNLGLLLGLGVGWTDRTSSQLKNAGGMRLINDVPLIERVVDYWKRGELIDALTDEIQEWRTKAREESYNIFDSKYYSMHQVNGSSMVLESPSLMTNNYKELASFVNRLAHIRNLVYNRYLSNLKAQITTAEKLMAAIREDYKIKN